MNKTNNSRFASPPEPKGGGKWLAGGLLMIPLWSVPVLGVGAIAASIGCLARGGKMNGERKMYQRFHEFCAVIGMRSRVPLRELAQTARMGRNEVRQYLQKMIAAGYFGNEARIERDYLVLPAPPGYAGTEKKGSWRENVMELIDHLRSELPNIFKPAEPGNPVHENPEPEAKATPQADPGKDYTMQLEKTLAELYQLNEQIEDAAVSQRIDRIGALTACIFRAVIDNPEREQDVRKFMNYYLPTTLKLLKSYDLLEKQSYQGENIAASRRKIENALDTLIEAYERQLDRLFKNDALDIATDIDVLETMMAGDGLLDKGEMKMM